jgi:hypothetical protein
MTGVTEMVAGLRSRSTGTRVLTLALLVLCMVTNQAPAQTVGPPWEKLGDTPALTLYIDRTTLQRDGSIRRVLEMQDLKVPDPDGVMSRRYTNEYDCDNQMHRIGRMTSWAGPQLTGRKVFDITEWGYWRKIPPNGLFTLGFKLLCPLRAGESLSP